MGPVSQRKAMGDGARGLQREWRRVGLFSTRTCTQPGLSLGRGWTRGSLRRSTAAVSVARPVEWQGSDSEGASLWPHQLPGKSWRGCQGNLLLSRCDSFALVLEDAVQVSAGGISLRTAGRGKPTPWPRPGRV